VNVDNLDKQDQPDSQVHLDQVDHQDQAVPVVNVVRQEHQDHKAPVVRVDLLEHVERVGQLDLQDHVASLAPPDQEGQTDNLVCLLVPYHLWYTISTRKPVRCA
jgi:hypothetical protein